jgi:hypothetical protein
MTYQKEREEFIAVMMQESDHNGEAFEAVEGILRLAQRLQRIAERECNGHQTPAGDWDAKAAQKDERAEVVAQTRIATLCKPFGWVPDFQGDPRGAVVKIKVPSGRTNDWGKVGICVPTRM